MYSGGDSSGDGVNSRNQFNWQITSQTSCNVNSGGVIDWASLAQQWIQMKDSGAGLPDTPPPPIISANAKSNKITKFDEQGEADMEVEKEDEQQIVGFGQTISSSQTENLNTGRWFPPQDSVPYCAPPQNQWTSWSARVTLPPPALHVPITTGSLTPPIPKEIVPSTTPPLKSIPNLPKHPNEMTSMLPSKESLELPPMDAAKRKILPAWIREGLEKMEREKLKQLERGHKDKDPSIAGTPTADSDINSKIKTMVKNSIMEMDGESSGNEAAVAAKSPAPYDLDTDRAVASASTQLLTSVPQERANSLSGKTYEERMADMMIAVRKTLTELLLEVTNDEISSIAYEAIRKRRAKASSAQVIRKSAITSITGKLGLEAYADSDTDNSASDNDTNNDESRRSDDENDSEEELKANIRICKRAFAKTVEEIEEKIQAAAAREEMLLRERQKRNSRDYAADARRSPMHKSKGFDKEIGEPQPDKKSNSNGKRRKERTSRFSDNKDSRNRAATNYFPAPSINSGNLSSQAVPGSGSSGSAPTNVTSAKYKVNNASASSALASTLPNDKRSSSSYSANKLSKPTPTATSSSTTSKHHRHSDSPSNSSDSSSSGTRSSHSRRSKYSASRHKRSSTERSKRSHCSSSYRSSRRRDSSDSNDNDHYKKHRQAKTTSSSLYSRRHGRRRSDSRSSRSRTRSRSRSRSTTYSSSRRTDRY